MQLARDFPTVNIIGLGAQDSLDEANGFVDRTATGGGEIDMVWDPSFDSWRSFGIRAQPYWILYGADGEVVFSRPGKVDIAAVQSVL